MTRKALARRIAEPYLTSQQRREAPAPPQPEGLRGFWPGALLLVSQRPRRVFSFLAPRIQAKIRSSAVLSQRHNGNVLIRGGRFGSSSTDYPLSSQRAGDTTFHKIRLFLQLARK
jgi:hypothetical protein